MSAALATWARALDVPAEWPQGDEYQLALSVARRHGLDAIERLAWLALRRTDADREVACTMLKSAGYLLSTAGYADRDELRRRMERAQRIAKMVLV